MGITPRRQRSQVLIVFAITVTSILGVIGLLYTFGVVLAQRRALQTAADAASLRGSWQVLQELASDDLRDAQVGDAVVLFAKHNGLPADASTYDASYLTAFYVDAAGALLSPSVQVGSAAGGKFPPAARGVQVAVNNQVPTILPRFLSGWQLIAVRDGATATARSTTLAAASLVLPIAVKSTDALTDYTGYATYDLFGPNARTLDLTTTTGAGGAAPSYGSQATNAQAWSDGAHLGSWQMFPLATVNLADAAYHAEIAAGLGTNFTRQLLNDASGAADPAYALVMVPVYDTATPTSIHVAGFAELKIARRAPVSAASAVGRFVPYATAAWGPYAPPAVPDFGAALVSLVS